MLLIMCVGASWAQTTGTIAVSTTVDSPEHVYYMKNGNNRWMTRTSGPTVTLDNRAQFAFFAGTRTGEGSETAYKIYCVTAQKWLSYTKAGSYDNGTNKATLVESQEEAESWAATIQDGKGNIGNVYQFAPYNTSGVESKYMNWHGGADYNPNDNTHISVGLWRDNATADNGSCWVLVDAALDAMVRNQTMVRLKNKTTGLYMTITSPNGTNQNDGGVELGEKIADTDAGCLNQVFYLKSPNNDGTCEIQTVSVKGYYLQSFSSWGYKASAEKTSDASHIIEAVDDYYLLHTTKGYAGSNNGETAAGSHIYSNHPVTKTNIKWSFEALDETEVAAVGSLVAKEIKDEYAAWMTQSVGDLLGQYYMPEENAEAYATAKAALDVATTIAEAQAAMTECKNLHTLRGLIPGNYYRIKNTAQGSFLGIDGYTLNMKHQAENNANPSLVWKYEQDGDNYYLKNVYAGLYPQNIPSGSGSTAKIGTGKEKKFTYALFAVATETEAAKWNIFFGGTQVNCEGSSGNEGNVNYWFGDNAHYYIYEVEVTDVANLEKMCTDWYAANPKANEDVSGVELIDIDANATVIVSPSEFADPREINAVINTYKDKLNLVAADATQAKVQDMYAALANWDIVRTYQNAVNSYGSLLSIPYTTTGAEFGTIILPVNWSVPAGWSAFTCAGAPGGALALDPREGESKNRPYIVQFGEEARNKTYQFIGYSNGAATTNQTGGLLTGVLESGTKVPAGSYILANRDGQIGFYRVAESADFTATVNKCYLTLPAESAARFEALFFDGTATAIEGVQDTQAKQNSGIYNMAGQRLSKLQKGLNIVNGKVVLVK